MVLRFGPSGGYALGFGGLAFGGSGGTPTPLPPFAFPSEKMLLGMGLTGVGSYFGYYPFANVLWNAATWSRESGSGTWSHSLGTLTTTNPTDVFAAKFGEGFGKTALPAGTYTVFNPDGCEVGIGWGGTPNITGWTTATEFTFTMTGATVIALYARGNVTNSSGPIQIIMPGRRDAFLAGNIWNPDFLTFLAALKVKCLRFMDWFTTYNDITEDWSELPSANSIMIKSPSTLQINKVPYSVAIDLCNRLKINPWINIPVRANDTYKDNLATLLRDTLDPSLYVYLEWGNETWNFGAPFNDARVWAELYDFTRYEMTPNAGISGFTSAAHGLATGDIISVFFTKDNFTQKTFEGGTGTQVYPLGYGTGLYVESVDANNFKLYSDVGRTTLVPPQTGVSKVIYKKRVEAGKVANVDANTGKQSLLTWNRMNAILGRNRCVNVLGTQAVNASLTTARLAPTGVKAACDAVAIAPYYSGEWWLGAVDISSGQLLPKAWANSANDPLSNGNSVSVRVAVYAVGSTPRLDEVLAGTGAGYIGHRDIPITTANSSSYTTGAAITGLTNGTSYVVFSVFSGRYGDKWMASASATVSATPSTVTMRDTNANLAKMARRNTRGSSIPAQIVAASPVPIVCYESGPDFFAAGSNTPVEVKALRTDFSSSPEFGAVLDYFYRVIASYGVKQANQFTDVNGGDPGVFSIADSFTDRSDPRVVAFAAFNGQVTDGAPPIVNSATGTNLTVEPSYPTVVYTFPDATLTYSIYSGDNADNFAIVGNQLRIVNGTGINWAVPTARNIVVEALGTDGADYPTISLSTGSAWYEADAKFAWNSIDDSDNAAINPVIGNTLTLTGTPAPITSGLWDMGAAGRYQANPGLISGYQGNKPILLAAVLDKDNHSSGYVAVVQIGSGTYMSLYVDGSVLAGYVVAGGATTTRCSATTPTGKHVYWVFYDADPTTPKIHAGLDQTKYAETAKSLAAYSFGAHCYVGGTGANNSNMKHGSMQVVNRAGMTLSDALAIVAKMQALHGI